MKAIKTVGLLIAAALLAQPVYSQELTGTLKKSRIAERLPWVRASPLHRSVIAWAELSLWVFQLIS